MAISASVETLIAAFFLGILLQAASGVLLIQVKGKDGPIREDGRRLALAMFLIFAAVWALADFINLNITSSTTSCQAVLIFSTLADQLARVSVEQFLMWSIGHGGIPTLGQLVLQFTLGVRFVIGAVFVGFTRPQFVPVCVARTSLLPIGITVLALDAIITIGLALCAILTSAPGRGQKKAIILMIVAFGLWTGTSSIMLLGMPTMMLIIRITLPSIGLFVLVGFVAIFAVIVLSPREGTVIPEATSPFVTQSLSPGRGFPESFGNRSLIPGDRFEPADAPLFSNPPTRPGALNSTITTIQGAYIENRIAPTSSRLDGKLPPSAENRRTHGAKWNESGNQALSRIPTSIFAIPAVDNNQRMPISQDSFVDSTERRLPAPVNETRTAQQKRSAFKWAKKTTPSSVRAIGISRPVIVDNDGSAQPFSRIKTIDLATAASNEKERREDAANRARLIPKRPAPPPPSASVDTALRKSISVKRKGVLGHHSEAITELPRSQFSGLSVGNVNASTTSASLSPGRENVRQRSPRSKNVFESVAVIDTSKSGLQRKPTNGLPSNPRAQKALRAEGIATGKRGNESYASESSVESTETMLETSYATELKSSGSILHRPRPYRRNTEKDRALFPSGAYPHHRRSKSGSPIAASRKSIFELHPGSPTQLPYMPAPPPRPSDFARILSDGNKSMTFHEKVQFLFPTPPLSTLTNSRRSSVPSLPRLPSVYMSDSSPLPSATEDGQQSSRASKKSRIISFETEDMWDSIGLPTDADGQISQHERSIKSTNTSDVDAFTFSGAIPTSQNGFSEAQFQFPKATTSEAARKHAQRRQRQKDSSDLYAFAGGRQSFLLDESQALPGDRSPTPMNEAVWHKRIGDELPTFSERRKNSKSRKMPPPTPLLLNWKGNNISVVVHSPAPSPIDSPGKAMKNLQAQLKHFEDPNHNSVHSSSPLMPLIESRVADSNKDGRNSRSRLLQDLEDEMGLQESLWQKMQHNFDRDSNSIMLTPQPPTPTEDDPLTGPPQQSVLRNGRAYIRKSLTKSRTSSSSTSSRGSNNTQRGGWQQRLSEAQMEYLESAPALNGNRNVNFFAIAKSQIGSPTPPESVGSETDIETGSESGFEMPDLEWQPQVELERCEDLLWKPQQTLSEPVAGSLWDPSSKVSRRTTAMDAPAKSLRPLKRLIQEPLSIWSSVLWSKPISSSTGTYIGLWGSRKVRPKSIVIRRTSQRPQRKSKRVGYLPDIVESPQPLPHKRDTLGIFQFPSGETSDSAVYHSAFSPTLFSTTKLSGVPQPKPANPGPDPMEYPSSFFDDYDEQDDSEGLDSDDDFDESTLWEISNLLYTKDVSSMEYFRPLAAEMEDGLVAYEDGIRFEMEPEGQEIIIGMSTELHQAVHGSISEFPIRPLALNSYAPAKLWAKNPNSKGRNNAIGLPQPDPKVWESYVSDSHSDLRLKFRQSQDLPILTTFSLWTLLDVEMPMKPNSGLWEAPPVPGDARQPEGYASKVTSNFLWAPAVQGPVHILAGANTPMLWALSKVSAAPTDIPFGKASDSTTCLKSLPIAKVRKDHAYNAPLAQLASRQLWTGHKILRTEHHWISESSVRPESPSVRSDSSSGGSSPTSDTLSVSSGSSKASSIWSSLKSVQVSLSWKTKPPKVMVLPKAAEAYKSSKSPISSPEPQVLETEPLREHPDFLPGINTDKCLNQAAELSPTRDVCFDVATRHPVFFTSNLESSIVDIHPAAIGYFTSPSVAFGSAPFFETTTNYEFLWSKDLAPQSSNRSEITPRMWTISPKTDNFKNTDSIQYFSQENSPGLEIGRIRKPPTPRQLPIPVITSSRLFESQDSTSEPPVHWLHSTSQMPESSTRSFVWDVPLSAPLEHENPGMWEPPKAAAPSSCQLFSNPHTAPWARKKRVSISAKDITSSELWRFPSELPSKPKNWLVDKRASRVQFRY